MSKAKNLFDDDGISGILHLRFTPVQNDRVVCHTERSEVSPVISK